MRKIDQRRRQRSTRPKEAATQGASPTSIHAKSIPASRDQMQSDLLVGAVGLLLAASAAIPLARLHANGPLPTWLFVSVAASIGFAALVWVLGSATGPAASLGGLLCLDVLLAQASGLGWRETAMPSLIALFVLTFAATRFGRSRKEALGLAESKRGRKASQVVANLGVAGLCAAGFSTAGSALASTPSSQTPTAYSATAFLVASLAALAEATADTLSSEMGQVFGGITLLMTTGRPVAPGTDGGISLAGTACGVIGAAIVVLVSPLGHRPLLLVVCFTAACFGLFVDSLLGATVERRGWLGNDLVNFSSTAVAALTAYAILRFAQ